MNSLLHAANAIASNSTEYIDVSDAHIIKLNVGSSSKGNQNKWYDTVNKMYIKEQFYYQGNYWKDYMVENLSTIIASRCNLTGVVEQHIVTLSTGRIGVASYDFCEPGARFVPIKEIIDSKFVVKNQGHPFKVYDYLIKKVSELGIDWHDYLNKMILLDFLLGNEDRHLNNFGLLEKDGKFEVAPLFDFGLGLFEHDMKYMTASLGICRYWMDGKPFSKDLRDPVDLVLNEDYDLCCNIANNVGKLDYELFPSKLAYDYFNESLSYLKGRCSY